MKKITLILSCVIIWGSGFCQSQGPNYPDTAYDNPLTGSVAWINPLNAKDSNNIYAYDSLTGVSLRSHYLEAQGFNFTIPATATIAGITVEVRGHQHNLSLARAMNYMRLVKGNVIQPDSIAGTGLSGAGDTWQTLGGCSNLWNDTTWNYLSINSPTFGVAYNATTVFLTLTGHYAIYIDALRVTICYTMPSSTETLSQTSTIGRVFPNPTKGMLELKYAGEYLVQLYDLTGKEVYSANLDGPQQVDISGLSGGMYLMHITQGGNTAIQKVVLQK